jgi:anthranilate phosphoribosyltransferase
MGLFEEQGAWPGVLGRLFTGGDLTSDVASAVFDQILEGDASPAQIAAFVAALRVKGETVEEMSGFVRIMLERAEPLSVEGDLVDTCGTGGDRTGSINVSTIAALILAGAGARVCKHGGRAASSQTGSADVLEALGVVIDLGPDGVKRCIEEVGIGFCFAPRFHPAMRHATPVRRELGVPTIFNFLGPLANPARACYQVIGVSEPEMALKMLGVMAANGCRRAMVVHGADGLDELSTTGPSRVHELTPEGTIIHGVVDPESLGFARATLEDLRGGDAARNAEAFRRVLAGDPGPHRDITVLNAAAGLVVVGMASDLPAGIEIANTVIDEGRASVVLDGLVRVSREATRS